MVVEDWSPFPTVRLRDGVQRRMSRAEGRIDANVRGLDMLRAAHEVDIWW